MSATTIMAADKKPKVDHPSVCHIGADPVDRHCREKTLRNFDLQHKKMIHVPPNDSRLVHIGSGSGKVSECLFSGDAVVDRVTGLWEFAVDCCNPFLEDVPREEPEVPPATITPPKPEEPKKTPPQENPPESGKVPPSPPPYFGDTIVHPFIGPTILVAGWNKFGDSSTTFGLGINGGVQKGSNVYEGDIFVLEQPELSGRSICKDVSWDNPDVAKAGYTPLWPIKHACFTAPAVDKGHVPGFALAWRYYGTIDEPGLWGWYVGPKVYHVQWTHDFEGTSFINGFAIGGGLDTDYGRFGLDVYQLDRPGLPAITDVQRVCWGEDCKDFHQEFPAVKAGHIQGVQLTWDYVW